MKKFRGKYWGTVYREVEFEATDLADAQDIMDGFPCNEGDIQFKEINGVEECSDFEVAEPLNADVRDLPIEMGKHTVKVDALINVAAGLAWDSGFGTAYLDKFDVRTTPTRIEVYDCKCLLLLRCDAERRRRQSAWHDGTYSGRGCHSRD